jgi:ribosomal protein S18 acetylase RimI-like enzyme
MSKSVELITVDAGNVEEHGFFCYKSKPKSEGYQRKTRWIQDHGKNDLKLKIIVEGERSVGFIEYAPGEHTWRVVDAPDFLVIHCLWVVGRSKGKGYGSILLSECVEDARRQGKKGVAMVTTRGNWLANEKALRKNGFEKTDSAPPAFDLMVKTLGGGSARPPQAAFPSNWEERLGRFPPGVTIVYADQCPYTPDAVKGAVKAFAERGIEARVVELESAAEVRERSPSAYGVFGIVWDGSLFSYHYLGRKELKLLDERIRMGR